MDRQALKNLNEQRYSKYCKTNLINNIKKKFNTTMIGSLSQFEKYFGVLWGHGLHSEDLTKDQLYYKQVWEEVRTNILNNGNNQARAATEEIAQHTIVWNKYKTEFIINQENQDG